jgi:hypothetical protein
MKGVGSNFFWVKLFIFLTHYANMAK